MFDDLQAKLATVDGKLRAVKAALSSAIDTVDKETQSLDSGLAASLDKMAAVATGAKGKIVARAAEIEARLKDLEPPG
jgi:capsule polysaccharide export protein KpsE/RkpR